MRVNINSFCFEVVEVAQQSPAGPNSISDFLSQSSFCILSQIVHIVFGLTKSDTQHKKSLRSWLKPECWKFQRLNQAAINHMNYSPTIYTISSKAIRIPTFWFEPTPQGLFMLSIA